MPGVPGFRYRANIRHFFVSLYFSGRFFLRVGDWGEKMGGWMKKVGDLFGG